MRLATLGLVVCGCMLTGKALAQDLQELDMAAVDSELLTEMFGPWEIRDAAGGKRCEVTLKRETTIGGMEIDIDPACAKTFPVMDEIAAWRLMEGWAIDLVDGERKTRIRFETPDASYVAFPETDGIFTIAP